MIGQYGAFDEAKYSRDYRPGFYGIEACLFQNEADTQRLIRASETDGFRIGVHYPLRAGMSGTRDALFLDRDAKVRTHAFDLIQQELEYLIPVKPAYVLFHYPKPVILDDRADWAQWRFADRGEYVYESDYSFEELRDRSARLFEWLSAKSEAYRFMPILEFDALNRYVYETNFLERLLDKHPRIRLCLDTGRLYQQERCDPNFDARAVIKKFARYAETIHLKNVQITDRIANNHYPALPRLKPEDGWAPIEDYLSIIRQENPGVKIMFEHRSDLISDEELQACYRWVEQLLSPERC